MNIRHEELISAYLDGELNAAETAEVQQLLADSADARALVDELRGLRDGLRALPRYQVDAGFAARVLERATRAKATASSSAAPVGGNHSTRPTAQPVRPAKTADGDTTYPLATSGRWRGMIWAGLALAAAVLIMLYGGPQQDPELAHNETPDAGAAVTRDETEIPVMAAKQQERGSVDGELVASNSANDDADLDALADDQRFADESADDLSRDKVFRARDGKAELAGPIQPMRAGGDGAPATAPAEADPLGNTEDAAGQPVDRFADGNKAKKYEAKGADPGDPFDSPVAELRQEQEQEKLAEEEAELFSLAQKETAASSQDNGIAVFDYTASTKPGGVKDVNSQVRRQLSEAVKREAGPGVKARDTVVDMLAKVAPGSSRLQDVDKPDGGVELVYAIEGTNQQIAAVLDRLQAQPEAFRLVAVDQRLSAAWGENLRGRFHVAEKGLVHSRASRNETDESDNGFGSLVDADAESSRDPQSSLKNAAGRRASVSKNAAAGDAGPSRPATAGQSGTIEGKSNRTPRANAAEVVEGAQQPRPQPDAIGKQDAAASSPPSDGIAVQGAGAEASGKGGSALEKTRPSPADLPTAELPKAGSEAAKPSRTRAPAAPTGRGSEKQRKNVQRPAADASRTAQLPQVAASKIAERFDQRSDHLADAADEKKSPQNAQPLHRILLVIRVGGAVVAVDSAARTGLKALDGDDAPAASLEEASE